MKKKYGGYVAFLIVFVVAFGVSRWQSGKGAESAQSYISDALEIDVSKGEEISATDSHGGFHGDGTAFVVLRFSDEEFASEVKANSEWKELPLDESLTALVYGLKSEGGASGPYLTDDGGKVLFPQITNGYYYFEDRHATSETNADIFGRASFNLTIAIYDIDTKTLYYCEFDT